MVRNAISNWRASVGPYFDALTWLGLIVTVAGAAWLSVGGAQSITAAILGSGLAMMVASITGKKSAHEQYARDANLKRRDELYAPLHAELKRLHDLLEAGQSGSGPFPQWIGVAGEQPRDFKADYGWPNLSEWPAFARDYRVQQFSEPSRRLLATVHELAEHYNAAVRGALAQSMTIIRPHLTVAIEAAWQTPEFKDWEDERVRLGNSGAKVKNDWFQSITQVWNPVVEKGDASDKARQLLEAWFTSHPMYEPETLGWLLAEQPRQAAACIAWRYRPGLSAPSPPVDWMEQVFREAWPVLETDPTYVAFWTRQRELFNRVAHAKAIFERGLLDIQQRYEGGPPPI